LFVLVGVAQDELAGLHHLGAEMILPLLAFGRSWVDLAHIGLRDAVLVAEVLVAILTIDALGDESAMNF
jgi:hypothetical protein